MIRWQVREGLGLSYSDRDSANVRVGSCEHRSFQDCQLNANKIVTGLFPKILPFSQTHLMLSFCYRRANPAVVSCNATSLISVQLLRRSSSSYLEGDTGVVLKHGRVVEQGTRDVLMGRRAEYFHLVEAQRTAEYRHDADDGVAAEISHDEKQHGMQVAAGNKAILETKEFSDAHPAMTVLQSPPSAVATTKD